MVRVAVALALGAFGLGCSSMHGLHSARALGAGKRQVGLAWGHSVAAEQPAPLKGGDPHSHADTLDGSYRAGISAGLDGYARIGTSGIEGGLVRQLSNPQNEWFAVAALLSARGRLALSRTSEAWRLLEFMACVPVEFDPHPRVAVILEPKVLLSLAPGCGETSTCGYFPFHGAMTGGVLFRSEGGVAVGLEVSWYPLPLRQEREIDPLRRAWEGVLSVSVDL